jgi:hypothetical protein
VAFTPPGTRTFEMVTAAVNVMRAPMMYSIYSRYPDAWERQLTSSMYRA